MSTLYSPFKFNQLYLYSSIGTILTAANKNTLSRTPNNPLPKLRISEGRISPKIEIVQNFFWKFFFCEKIGPGVITHECLN